MSAVSPATEACDKLTLITRKRLDKRRPAATPDLQPRLGVLAALDCCLWCCYRCRSGGFGNLALAECFLTSSLLCSLALVRLMSATSLTLPLPPTSICALIAARARWSSSFSCLFLSASFTASFACSSSLIFPVSCPALRRIASFAFCSFWFCLSCRARFSASLARRSASLAFFSSSVRGLI